MATVSRNWNDVAYGNGRWIAVNNFGYIVTSTDNGKTWSVQPVSRTGEVLPMITVDGLW
jgi:hypothetical protein